MALPLESALNELGLSALLARFVTEKIDSKQIIDMTDRDLINLGVSTLGDRMRLKALLSEAPRDRDAQTQSSVTAEEIQKKALERYNEANATGPERLVSGSDDFTLFLWHPELDKKPVARMTGHQQLINDVRFSPDTRLLASASFDKSVKLWDGKTGKFLATLRGHVSRVYQIAWSADSRLLCSGSSDSTLKVWDMKTKKLLYDLPGHADEVYAVDWSPDGQRVVSGGKDKVLKIWRK